MKLTVFALLLLMIGCRTDQPATVPVKVLGPETTTPTVEVGSLRVRCLANLVGDTMWVIDEYDGDPKEGDAFGWIERTRYPLYRDEPNHYMARKDADAMVARIKKARREKVVFDSLHTFHEVTP